MVVPTSGSLLWNAGLWKSGGVTPRSVQPPRTPVRGACIRSPLSLLGAFRLAGELLLHASGLIDETETNPFDHCLVLHGSGGAAQFLGCESSGHLLLRERTHLLQICGRPRGIVLTG